MLPCVPPAVLRCWDQVPQISAGLGWRNFATFEEIKGLERSVTLATTASSSASFAKMRAVAESANLAGHRMICGVPVGVADAGRWPISFLANRGGEASASDPTACRWFQKPSSPGASAARSVTGTWKRSRGCTPSLSELTARGGNPAGDGPWVRSGGGAEGWKNRV